MRWSELEQGVQFGTRLVQIGPFVEFFSNPQISKLVRDSKNPSEEKICAIDQAFSVNKFFWNRSTRFHFTSQKPPRGPNWTSSP